MQMLASERINGRDKDIIRYLERKTAVSGLSLAGPDASALQDIPAVLAYVDLLQSDSFWSRLLADNPIVPAIFNERGVSVTGGFSALVRTPPDGFAIVPSKLTISSQYVVKLRTVVALVVETSELVRFSGPGGAALISRHIDLAVASSQDRELFSVLLAGVPVHTSSGNPLVDTAQLLQEVHSEGSAAASSIGYLLRMSPIKRLWQYPQVERSYSRSCRQQVVRCLICLRSCPVYYQLAR
jgi:hypothetical protein